jgi:hypothetical protein
MNRFDNNGDNKVELVISEHATLFTAVLAIMHDQQTEQK